MKKLEKLEMILKSAIFKRECRSKVKNHTNKLGIKWYGNRLKIQLKGCYRMGIISEAFARAIAS